MKKILLMFLIPFCFSCVKSNETQEPNKEDIRYYTKNSQKAGVIINNELKNKNVLVVKYPEYVSQSYELIKFLTATMNNGESTTVYIPRLPHNNNMPIEESILKLSPLLGFNEFIDLYNFCLTMEVQVTEDLTYTTDKLLILAPESQSQVINEEVLKIYNEKELLYVEMVGTKDTNNLFNVVRKLPLGKQISSAYLIEDPSKVIILFGDVINYRPITPIVLYSLENYLDAPQEFLESNKSIFKTTQINKMNSNLQTLIINSFKRYGETK